MKSGKDHRSYPRALSKIEIEFFSEQLPDKKKGFTRDFSATGISFPVPERYETGALISLELKLVDIDKIIKTKASVIRNWEEDGVNYISVQFFDINYHDFITLLDYSLTFEIEN